MLDERISLRVTNDFKNKLSLVAKEEDLSISQYIMSVLEKELERKNLVDSQSQFLELFDVAFKRSIDSYFNQLMLVLNKNNFNTECHLKQTDLFMKQLKIPQNRDDVMIPLFEHPITEISKELVLKDIRSMRSKKGNNSNE